MNAWRDIVERYFPLSTTATVEARSGGAPAAEDADEEAAASDARERAKLFGETAVDRMRLQLEEQRLTCVLHIFLLFSSLLFSFLTAVYITLSLIYVLCLIISYVRAQEQRRRAEASEKRGAAAARSKGESGKGGEKERRKKKKKKKEKEKEKEKGAEKTGEQERSEAVSAK